MRIRAIWGTAALVMLVTGAPIGAGRDMRLPVAGVCTMTPPDSQTTVEASIVNARDFCELASRALASEVFRSPVIVTLGQLWHYEGAAVSCRLRYRQTDYRITVRQSEPACRWFTRRGTGWIAGSVEDGA